MQEFLPIIKTTLLEWAQLTFANPLYAAFLILATGLLVVIVDTIKSIPIKRKAAASEKARVELANNLSMAQQQATGLQQRLVQRNQQVSDTIQALAAGFDLGEQPLPAIGEDLVSEDLWQQHDRVIAQLANRLRSEQQAKAELQQSYQAETGKRIEKEALIDNLQNTLTEKTLHISGLEQQTAEILEKHIAQSARLAELEQQSLEWLDTKKQREQLEEQLAAKESELSQLQMQAEARKEAESIRPQIHAEPVAEAEPIQPQIHAEPIREAEPIQPQIHQEPVKEPEPIQPQIQAGAGQAVEVSPPAIEEAIGAQGAQQTIVLSDWDYQPEAASSTAEARAASSVKESEGGGLAGKFKSLFGKSKQNTAMTDAEEAKAAEPSQAAVQPPSSNEGEHAAGTAPSQLGKIKNLLGLSKQKAAAEETGSAESETVEPAPLSESADAAESSASSAKSPMKKIKNLFRAAK
jgi:hypothetical protein